MKLPDEIVIVGAGGHAKVVIATIRAAGGEVVAAYDDDEGRWGSRVLGVTIRGTASEAELSGVPAVIAIGDNRARQTVADQIPADWMTVLHPSAIVHPSASIGRGTVVFAGTVIQPEAAVGDHVIVNTAASIDHDCNIGDFVHLGPGARLCGGVTVREGALLGVGAKVAPGVSIGPWATVGAGGVCVTDVAESSTVVGVPARPSESHR